MKPLPSLTACCLFFLAILLFQSCARVQRQPLTKIPTIQNEKDLVLLLKEQDRLVQTLVATGKMTLADRSSVDLLIAANRDPVKIKIEITHPWGRPLMHALVQDSRVEILSFPEKRYYRGQLGSDSPSPLFPTNLDMVQLWSVVRGFPAWVEGSYTVSQGNKRIIIQNRAGQPVQIVLLDPGTLYPRSIQFPEKKVRVSLSQYAEQDGVLYARYLELDDPRTQAPVPIRLKQAVFNEVLPEMVFALNKPAHFESIRIEDLKSEPRP